MPETENRRFSKYLAIVADKILLPFLLVILGIVIFDPIKDWWIGPKSYKVYLVGARTDEIDKIFRGVRLGSGVEPLQIDDVPITLETTEDLGEASTTAKRIAAEKDVLLVIGHVYSQRTIDALPTYMGADPPIPVIATKETNPDLLSTSPKCTNLGCPLLQMSPTDDEQARDGLDFAFTQLPKRRMLAGGTGENQTDHYNFLILKEANGINPSYADNLTKKYVSLLEEADYLKKGAFDQGTINIGDAATFLNIASSIINYKPDVVIYVGQSPLARQFFTALHDQLPPPPTADPKLPAGAPRKDVVKYQPPLILLCDAAVSPEVLNKGFLGIQDVFATYPLSSLAYKETESVLGRDAFAIVAGLVKEAGYHRPLKQGGGWAYTLRRTLQMHRVKDARAALAAAIINASEGNEDFKGPTMNEYAFEFPYHHRKNGRFHVWSISGSRVIEADPMDGDPIYVGEAGTTISGPARKPQPQFARALETSLPAKGSE